MRKSGSDFDPLADTIKVMTMHASKGLEFPVVYVPFGWDRFVGDPPFPLLHDAAGRRVLDVGGPTGDDWTARCAAHRAEEAGEDLRLLYVALTRATKRVAVVHAEPLPVALCD